MRLSCIPGWRTFKVPLKGFSFSSLNECRVTEIGVLSIELCGMTNNCPVLSKSIKVARIFFITCSGRNIASDWDGKGIGRKRVGICP